MTYSISEHVHTPMPHQNPSTQCALILSIIEGIVSVVGQRKAEESKERR